MRGSPFLGAIALTLLIASCGSFSGTSATNDAGIDASDDASTDGGKQCTIEACKDPTLCQRFDFAAGCDPKWSFYPQADIASVTADCSGGRIHLVAKNTLDIGAGAELETPNRPYKARIAARIGVTVWDGNAVFEVDIDGSVLFAIKATRGPNDTIEMQLCREAVCSPEVFKTTSGSEHVFIVDLDANGVTATADDDCKKFGTLSAVPLATAATLAIEFGVPGGAEPAIDGTLDDVLVSYTEL